MTPSLLEAVYVRSPAGRSQVLRTGSAHTLAEHLLLRVNGYSPLKLLVTPGEQPQVADAVDELLSKGWIEPVRDLSAAPTESQWGAIDDLGMAA